MCFSPSYRGFLFLSIFSSPRTYYAVQAGLKAHRDPSGSASSVLWLKVCSVCQCAQLLRINLENWLIGLISKVVFIVLRLPLFHINYRFGLLFPKQLRCVFSWNLVVFRNWFLGKWFTSQNWNPVIHEHGFFSVGGSSLDSLWEAVWSVGYAILATSYSLLHGNGFPWHLLIS